MTPVTKQKRQALQQFIDLVLRLHPAIQAVIGIGSIASGHMRSGSDVDIIVFMEPFDWYILPAEFKWQMEDGTFHGIFSDVDSPDETMLKLDCTRFDLAEWQQPDFVWLEAHCAELQVGWIAFDRNGQVADLIADRIVYPNDMRLSRLDEAITWLGKNLEEEMLSMRWQTLGPAVAHDRLQATFHYLVRGLFAYNRHWLPWRNRTMIFLLRLPWLPDNFEERVQTAVTPPSSDYDGYLARAHQLQSLFQDLLNQVVVDGLYGFAPVDQAFVRSHPEPGYAWNMDDWERERIQRALKDSGQP